VPVGSDKVALKPSARRALREQALPLVFRAEGPLLSRLARAAGQRGRADALAVEGVPVPLASLMKNTANQTIVGSRRPPNASSRAS
jgi:hypothetical protein